MSGGRIIFKNTVTDSQLSEGLTSGEYAIGFTNDGVFKKSEEGASASLIDSQSVSQIKITLTQSQIFGLSSSPVLAISAPGSGKAILVDSLSTKMTYVITQYDGGTDLIVKSQNALDYQLSSTIINATYSKFIIGTHPTPIDNQIVENDDIYITTQSDSTTGDGTIDVYLTYKIITL